MRERAISLCLILCCVLSCYLLLLFFFIVTSFLSFFLFCLTLRVSTQCFTKPLPLVWVGACPPLRSAAVCSPPCSRTPRALILLSCAGAPGGTAARLQKRRLGLVRGSAGQSQRCRLLMQRRGSWRRGGGVGGVYFSLICH